MRSIKFAHYFAGKLVKVVVEEADKGEITKISREESNISATDKEVQIGLDTSPRHIMNR